MVSNIKIRSFTNGAVKPYIHSLAAMRKEIFQEFPFLNERSLEEEVLYLKRVAQCKESVTVIVFDGSKIVGHAIGLPLEDEPREIQTPFKEQSHRLSDYFFFGESFLQKEYRGRGIGHHLFDHREAHAKHLKRFKHACFACLVRPHDHPSKPKDHISLDNFWKKRGYALHPHLKSKASWQDIGDTKPTHKPLVIWTKEI
jgi:GNAT superfamily N-acetyltransferase